MSRFIYSVCARKGKMLGIDGGQMAIPINLKLAI